LHCNIKNAALHVLNGAEGATMPIAKRFRRQAATCVALAKQTHDDEGRQRYLRLAQMYHKLIETEERAGSPVSAAARDSDAKPPD
jgi:hypothetical protein